MKRMAKEVKAMEFWELGRYESLLSERNATGRQLEKAKNKIDELEWRMTQDGIDELEYTMDCQAHEIGYLQSQLD